MLNVYVRAILCATLIVFTIQSLIFGCAWIFNHIHKEFLATILVTLFGSSALVVAVLIIGFLFNGVGIHG